MGKASRRKWERRPASFDEAAFAKRVADSVEFRDRVNEVAARVLPLALAREMERMVARRRP